MFHRNKPLLSRSLRFLQPFFNFVPITDLGQTTLRLFRKNSDMPEHTAQATRRGSEDQNNRG